MASVEYKSRARPSDTRFTDKDVPCVIVTADNGEMRVWPAAEFKADELGCIAATGDGIAPPTREPDPIADSIAALVKESSALKAVLIDKAVVTDAEVQAKLDAAVAVRLAAVRAELPAVGSYYLRNDDGTISLVKNGVPQTTFNPADKGPDQDAFLLWSDKGGVPL